jgi:Domain of unknown function (DUF4062)
MSPRVFVSSVIEGFSAYRRAARLGIEKAGCEPVLVNEDFPAKAASSRNTCLDAIDSCDIFILILGARGGWETPSGRLVVEEEFEHARGRKLPVLVFLEDVSRDPEAQRLERTLSDYVDGNFRVKFSGLPALQDHIERALNAISPSRNNRTMDHDPVAAHLLKPFRFADETSLRLGIAPEREEEVFDPLALASPEFTRQIMELGHKADVSLFDYSHAKDAPQFQQEWYVIEQPLGNNWSSGRHGVRLAIAEKGLILIDMNVTGLRPRNGSADMVAMMTVALDDVETSMNACFQFVRALYDQKDAYKRHQRFYWNAALSGMGYRKFVRDPVKQSQYSMSMSDRNQILPAFPKARAIARADLAQPTKEIERAILYWQREKSDGR